MLKIAICEDEKWYADKLEKGLRIWAAKMTVNVRIEKYIGEDLLLFDKKGNGMYDLVFLDIEMGSRNGLEIAAEIRETDYMTTLIFISQYENYYKKAYQAHPFYFLSKPVDVIELEETMDAYMKMKKQDMESFTFSIRKTHYNLRLNDIIYFYSEHRHVTAVCKEQRYSFYGKLSEVQKELEKRTNRFLRIHQSYLVNTRYIKEYHYSSVVLHNGEKLHISRDNRRSMNDIHMLLLGESYDNVQA